MTVGGQGTGHVLERDSELAEFRMRLEDAGEGRGSSIVVRGAAGIGKTTLLELAGDLGEQAGLVSFTARGYELEQEFAFGVVRQLFERRLARAPAGERRALLSGPAHLAASLLSVGSRQTDPLPMDASFAVMHSLYWLVANLSARGPVLLVVDDAHWCDVPSLRWLNFLAARVSELPVLVALGARPGEDSRAGGLLDALVSLPSVDQQSLRPLSDAAVGELVRRRLPDAEDPFCVACHRATAGNPFYLNELLAAVSADRIDPTAAAAARVAEQRSESIARSLLVRLLRLPPGAREVLRAAAVLGRDAHLRHVAALTGLDERTVGGAVDLLFTLEILAADRPLGFVHPIVRAVIYGDIPAGERAQLHRDAARLLAADGEPAERVAAHLLVCEPDGDLSAVQTLRAAAAAAFTRGAPDAGLVYLRRALAEPPPPDLRVPVLHEIGRMEFLCRDSDALQHLHDAIELTTEPVGRAVVARDLAMALVVAARPAEAAELLERAILDLGESDSQLSMSLEAQMLGAGVIHAATRPLHKERMTALCERRLGGSFAERLLLANLTCWASIEGKSRAVVSELAERALGGERLLAEVGSESQFFYLVTNGLFFAECFDFAERLLSEAIEDGRRRGSLTGFALGSAWRAYSEHRRGALADAEADAVAALAVAGPAGYERVAEEIMIEVHLERGQLTQAAAVLEQTDIDLDDADGMLANALRHARGRLRVAQGRLQEGACDLLAVGDWVTRWASGACMFYPWQSGAALALAQLEDRERARRLAESELAAARDQDRPRALGIALRAAGLLSSGPDGIALLDEAVRVLADTPAALEHARALVDYGAALRRANHRSAAREPLRQGLELARHCGATALAERGQQELIQTGARVPRLALSGLDALTPTERRVAEFAASGLSNPEIAQSLFVTTKTVETHLHHVYRKLDISSRRELPEMLCADTARLRGATGPAHA